MRRSQLFEFMDLPWIPARLRDLLRDQLVAADRLFPKYDAVVPLLESLLADSTSAWVIDLCAGSGGPSVRLGPALQRRGTAEGFVVTDLYPHCDGAPGPGLRFHPEPVDATQVPEALAGPRTLFNAFHHFPPELARGILADAARARQPILITEMVQRSWSGFYVALGCALISPVSVWLLRPRAPDQILLNTVFPLVPLMLLWEGFASCLRAYSPSELEELTQGLGGADYRWEIGTLRTGRVTRIYYLLGAPVDASGGG